MRLRGTPRNLEPFSIACRANAFRAKRTQQMRCCPATVGVLAVCREAVRLGGRFSKEGRGRRGGRGARPGGRARGAAAPGGGGGVGGVACPPRGAPPPRRTPPPGRSARSRSAANLDSSHAQPCHGRVEDDGGEVPKHAVKREAARSDVFEGRHIYERVVRTHRLEGPVQRAPCR